MILDSICTVLDSICTAAAAIPRSRVGGVPRLFDSPLLGFLVPSGYIWMVNCIVSCIKLQMAQCDAIEY